MVRALIGVFVVLLLHGPDPATLPILVVTREGKPVAGADVWVTRGGAVGNQRGLKQKAPVVTGVTDADGRFSVRGVPRSTVLTVVASTNGFARGNLCIRIPEEGETKEAVIRLFPAGSIRGVVSAPDGKPQAGATVYAIPAEGPVSALRHRPDDTRVAIRDSDGNTELVGAERAITDKRGRYSIDTAPIGRKMAVRAQARGLPTTDWIEPVEVTKEEPVVELNLRFSVPVRLRVNVRNTDGKPVAGAWVRLSDLIGYQLTDKIGRAVIPAVAPGKQTILASKRGWLTARKTIAVAIGSKQQVEIVLLRGGLIRGSVLKPDGTAIDGHLGLRILDAKGEVQNEKRNTEKDGTFESRVPPGVYRIEIHDNAEQALVLAAMDGVKVESEKETSVRLEVPE